MGYFFLGVDAYRLQKKITHGQKKQASRLATLFQKIPFLQMALFTFVLGIFFIYQE